jgi:hypothetical protein
MQILDIFLLFGAPNILQSDNGAEFTVSIISQLKDLWPECKVVVLLKLHKFYSN